MSDIIAFQPKIEAQPAQGGRMSWMRWMPTARPSQDDVHAFFLDLGVPAPTARHFLKRLREAHDTPLLLSGDIDAPSTILKAMHLGISIRIP